MSSLNSLFNRATIGTRCKTCLNLAISRIKLLRNKRQAQLDGMRKEIFQYLRTSQESVARIRVEHIIREQNILAAYDVLELFCEFVLARVPILESKKECPVELQEAIASIIYASSRCSDLPELTSIRNLFGTKYGKEFVTSALELRPDSCVNRTVIEKLSVKAPSAESKLSVLKSIAEEHGLEWDSSATEAQFNKKYEDLLDGSESSQNKPLPLSSPKEDRTVRSPVQAKQTSQTASSSVPPNQSMVHSTEGEKLPASRDPSDVLKRAHEAIALADSACNAARLAVSLANVKLSVNTS
ncbi:Regulator of Vps4 activity in the MVB pathway protein [Rhynchospora pubera]|uniref:Regulator of Vps4 activity in the MVB pathway protein n=1 Tax=Rhynchospora pubera TaxID=906938 RepID=A0AAV8G0K1_9POAL|nr:Regulator of Vps4 activity in the MVB pathway protein [Rhynchospora pubera]